MSADVDEMFEKKEIKHRQHPGIQKKNPISLPEDLNNSVDKILSGKFKFQFLINRNKYILKIIICLFINILSENIFSTLKKKSKIVLIM